MDEKQSTPPAAPNAKTRYWLRVIGLAVFAVVISIVVSVVAQSLKWPHPEAISFGAFITLIPILQAVADRRRVRNWPVRLLASLGMGLVAGLIYALWLER